MCEAVIHAAAQGLSGVPIWGPHLGMNRILSRAILPRDYLADPVVRLLAISGQLFQKIGSIELATAAYRAIASLQYHRGARDALGGWESFRVVASEFAAGAGRG